MYFFYFFTWEMNTTTPDERKRLTALENLKRAREAKKLKAVNINSIQEKQFIPLNNDQKIGQVINSPSFDISYNEEEEEEDSFDRNEIRSKKQRISGLEAVISDYIPEPRKNVIIKKQKTNHDFIKSPQENKSFVDNVKKSMVDATYQVMPQLSFSLLLLAGSMALRFFSSNTMDHSEKPNFKASPQNEDNISQGKMEIKESIHSSSPISFL